MVNVDDILKQQLLESLDEKYFNGQRQAYINCSSHTLSDLMQHLNYDHGTISPIDIEESEQKIKQKWSVLDPMVDLFELIEELVEFSEAANPPIPGGKVINIAYLLILRTGGMVKACKQWEDISCWPKNMAGFQGPFLTIL